MCQLGRCSVLTCSYGWCLSIRPMTPCMWLELDHIMRPAVCTERLRWTRILIECTRIPPFGFDTAEISSNSNEDIVFFKKTYCARILIESTCFPPFGFDMTEICSSSNENMSFFQKDLSCPDPDRERSVSPLRVRYSGGKLEFE